MQTQSIVLDFHTAFVVKETRYDTDETRNFVNFFLGFDLIKSLAVIKKHNTAVIVVS